MFKPVSSKVNFPDLEERILRFWKERQVFEKSVSSRQNSPKFIVYDGPPTANGNPGIHHVLSRVFKDVIPRYKTMKGYCVPRKAGWDTHGLPVELEVEKKLGLNNKSQIEQFGIAEFNSKCRESVLGYLKEWNRLTERIGYWLDLNNPYITFDNNYIESCWWVTKQLWGDNKNNRLINQGYRVTPHCPRCGTSLSSHEVALGYKETDDPSVYVKFKVVDVFNNKILSGLNSGSKPVYLLAWTTTPWTLPGNTALAVSGKADYSLLEGSDDYLIMATALLDKVELKGYEEKSKLKGSTLANTKDSNLGVRYEPLFNPHHYGTKRKRFRSHAVKDEMLQVSLDDQAEDHDLTYPVIAAEFVSMEDGTGIVHIAPSFGEDDFYTGRENALDFVRDYVDLQGIIQGTYPFAGKFVKKADHIILQELKSRGILLQSGIVHHTYPFCWRCETPLLYYAKPSWYIRTTLRKDELVAGNESINWYPEYIKHGRFGDWLENNVDWAFSRERYWGTPIPIWTCEQCSGDPVCIGSIDELKKRPGLEGLIEPLDLHRPFVDKITFDCPHCGGKMKRVNEVFDAWFDSGAMPVAQFHYPFDNPDIFKDSFPADYICEAIDQTRGWFYTLHALSTLLFKSPCYKNVICLGHILDAQGEKMSKTRGNVIDPWTIINKQGADALRWYMFTATPPGNAKRFSADLVTEAMRRFLSTLWNTYSFFVMYANIDQYNPVQAEAPKELTELDKWIISELNLLILQVNEAFDNYDPTGAGRNIEEFVDRLSNWYIRRSRRRFWKSGSDTDKMAAYFTLYNCLTSLAKLIAPLTPFVAEEIYQNLVRSVDTKAPESVHLCDYPVSDGSKIDDQLGTSTRLAMKICSLGRAARSKTNIKVRQPLEKVLINIVSKKDKKGLESLVPQILDELNVKALEFIEADDALWQDQLSYSSVSEGNLSVAVPKSIPAELIEEGIAREIVHRLQNMRRNAGFEIADHIITYYQAEPSLQKAIESLHEYIEQETLSQQIINESPGEGVFTEKYRIDSQSITLGVKRINPG